MTSFKTKFHCDVGEAVVFEVETKDNLYYISILSSASEYAYIVTLVDNDNRRAQVEIAQLYSTEAGGSMKPYESVYFKDSKIRVQFFVDVERIVITTEE